MSNAHQPTDDPAAQAACDPGRSSACPSCGGTKWVLWLGLIALAGAYLYTTRSGPAAPAAVAWVHDYEEGMHEASKQGKPVLLAFKASWCGPCKWMDNEVFSKPSAAKALEGWVPIHLDLDEKPKLANQYRITGVPTLIALSPDGKELSRVDGAVGLSDFAAFLASAEAARRSTPKSG